MACYMLGCILGHEHTYDCMYEHLPLAIFKEHKFYNPIEIPKDDDKVLEENKPEGPIIEKSASEDLTEGTSTTSGENKIETTHDDTLSYETNSKIKAKVLPHLPCMMGKPKRGGGFAKSPKPKMVVNMNEYLKLESQGWKEIKEDKKLW